MGLISRRKLEKHALFSAPEGHPPSAIHGRRKKKCVFRGPLQAVREENRFGFSAKPTFQEVGLVLSTNRFLFEGALASNTHWASLRVHTVKFIGCGWARAGCHTR